MVVIVIVKFIIFSFLVIVFISLLNTSVAFDFQSSDYDESKERMPRIWEKHSKAKHVKQNLNQ